MTPSSLAFSIIHALYDPPENPCIPFLVEPMELKKGETAIDYIRTEQSDVPCGCGMPAHPVKINGQTVANHCEICWSNAIADMNAKKRQYETMVTDGCDPRIASRRMLASKP